MVLLLPLLLGLGGPLGWRLPGACAQVPGTRFSDPHSSRPPGASGTEAEVIGGDPVRRNWCPYQKSRLVTYIAACNTEKFLVHSQQPCPQRAPDCQRSKIMYRMAQKPVYQVKQKVLMTVAWRCCPGFQGPDCQHHDLTATLETAEPGDGLQEHRDLPGHPAAELDKVEVQQKQQERLLGNLQNDVHQAAGSLPDLWDTLASNLRAATTTEANQAVFEFRGSPVEQTHLPDMDTFLQTHFSPIWRSFNQSLHSLSEAVRNLSLDVEANRQAIKRVQESTVARADFQGLGAKFEAKAQENAQRVGQLQQYVEHRLQAQNLSLHRSLSEVQANVDTKFKQLLKVQEPLGVNGNPAVALAGVSARQEQESLLARLDQLQRNLFTLREAIGQREEELEDTLRDMRATLAQHTGEIKELYSESDDTFDQISKVEQQVEELQVNHTALRELRVSLMEKSLIMEENKEEMERRLLGLNLTIQHLQGSQEDLIKYVKDCKSQLHSDPGVIPEDHQRNVTRALEETRVSLDEWPQLDALRSTVVAVSQAVDAHKEEVEQARRDRARLRTQLHALGRDVGALKVAANETRDKTRALHSAFAALVKDALRHESMLAKLFGEDVMEAVSEEGSSDPLPLTYEQIRTILQDAASGLREQAIAWNALDARLEVLEQAARRAPHSGGGDDEPESTARAGPERDLLRLSSAVERLEHGCETWAASLNRSVEGLDRDLRQHQRVFHSLFGNFEELMASNVSLDLGKLQAMLNRKEKKHQKDPETPRKRDKKQAALLGDGHDEELLPGVPGTQFWQAGSPVAFYASLSEDVAAPQRVKFDTISINVGGSYFPEHGYFQAPEHGVYLFAVSVEFGIGLHSGQLVFGGHHQTLVHTTEQRSGSMATTFAMVELQKGERVWFELTQGAVIKRSPPGIAFGGFLMFKT